MIKLLIVLDLDGYEDVVDELRARVEVDIYDDVVAIWPHHNIQELPKPKQHNDYDNETLTAYKNGWNSCLGEIIEHDLWK